MNKKRLENEQSFHDERFAEDDSLRSGIKKYYSINKIAEETYKDHKINIHLFYFLCTNINNTIELREHEKMAWVEKKDFGKYDFAEGDGNILSLL